MKTRLFLAASGAGAGAQQSIWKVPGCSAYFAGAAFPYAYDQVDEFLGFTPEAYCSEDAAIEMAMAAYYRAWIPGTVATGVGLTAAVASLHPRRGKNRIHGAVMSAAGVKTYHYELDATCGAFARGKHGASADRAIISLANVPASLPDKTERATELFLKRPYWDALGRRAAEPPAKQTLYPGAFNPPHEGHLALASDQRAAFWIEASAPHKPALTLAEMVQRAKLLHGHERLFTSGYPLYLDKSNRFPGRSFVIGTDSFVRMLDPKWGVDPLDLLRKLSENETTLLVAGRTVKGRFMSADEAIASVPESGTLYYLKPLTGRWDVSSSELRDAAQVG